MNEILSRLFAAVFSNLSTPLFSAHAGDEAFSDSDEEVTEDEEPKKCPCGQDYVPTVQRHKEAHKANRCIPCYEAEGAIKLHKDYMSAKRGKQ